MPKLIYNNTKNSDLFYALQVQIPDSVFYLEFKNKALVYLDAREYGAFLEKNKNVNLQAVLLEPLLTEVSAVGGTANDIFKLALLILGKNNLLNQEITVPNSFPLDLADYLRSQGVKLIPTEPFSPQRTIKSEQEINFIKANLAITCQAFQLIEGVLRESVIQDQQIIWQKQVLTSELLKLEVAKFFSRENLFSTEGIIISCASQSAMPHHEGSGQLWPNQPIICDIFPKSGNNNYYADMTRTYFKGQPKPKLLKMYQAVKQAQESAIKAIKPGRSAKEIHKICAESILASGFEVGIIGFVHGTGHGLGLDIHEKPLLNAKSESILAEGNIVTVEPGLYYPELGGIRIEDVILVTKSGAVNLTGYPKDLLVF